ncbi:class I SAM-dependent methyltransferase [Haladaptatus salinisoli]|uniref:class I SAM-dependent methyltransferase n=1 Tax=Haladaptatus salinisoli TaxID=2884876 RepID=UPI001D09B065|nr:class I SAM-dependent methyltransferase [Haladaptatus salinisoli]
MNKVTIDIGCGDNPRDGAIGVDIRPYESCDIQADVCNLPFENESANQIYASQLLEHLNGEEQLPRAFKEISRVLEPNGEFIFDVPFGRTWQADPTHQTQWYFKTILYFLPRDEVARLGWDPTIFPDYYESDEISLELVERDAVAWLDVDWLPLRAFSFLVRQASKIITTDRWDGLPLGGGNLTFRLRKRTEVVE